MLALTRPVSPSIGRCELTFRERVPVDPDTAAAQHGAYEAALEAAGCTVVRVPAAPELPDAVFVEDTAVVTGDVAVLARPGAGSRRGEVDAVGRVLGEHRSLRRIEAPATLDGGDVLRVGRDVFVGASARTNAAGAAALKAILAPFGYTVRTVPVTDCLHLKSAVTVLGDRTLILNPEWVDAGRFEGCRAVAVDPTEPDAANVLALGDTVLMAAGRPATAARIAAEGFDVVEVEISELAKAEAGVTCCSLLVA